MLVVNQIHKIIFIDFHPYATAALRCTPIVGLILNNIKMKVDFELTLNNQLSWNLYHQRQVECQNYCCVSALLGLISGVYLIIVGGSAATIGTAVAVSSLILFLFTLGRIDGRHEPIKKNYEQRLKDIKESTRLIDEETARRENLIHELQLENRELDAKEKELDARILEQKKVLVELEEENRLLGSKPKEHAPEVAESVERAILEREKKIEEIQVEIDCLAEQIEHEPENVAELIQRQTQLYKQQILINRS